MESASQFEKEIAELKEFIAELKNDRAAQKEKEKRESWTKYTSMSLVFIAVLAAVATQWAGKYSSRVLVNLNDSTFNQAQASDQWSYYQAKSIKQNLYEALAEMPVAKATNGADDAAAQSQLTFKAKVAKYETEKAEIKAKAEQLEKARDTDREAATVASRHGGGMGSAVSVFQIAIAIGSICLVTKKRGLWYVSMALAGIAAAMMLKVWLT
jgi:hypothetical protein